MTDTHTIPEQLAAQVVIHPDGRVTFCMLTTEMLAVARAIAPHDPRLQRGDAPPAESEETP